MENKRSIKLFKQIDMLGKNYRVYILSANQEKLLTEVNAPQRFAEESKAFVKRKKYNKE